jgi:hypothetical protein
LDLGSQTISLFPEQAVPMAAGRRQEDSGAINAYTETELLDLQTNAT